ncbi:hypothetical protein [Alloalcanivorax xenomutans]|uniref:hypothetical protein n=1 Tax=Alloalcanivorax xenomutans TaxID=1094342 RepID=UPI0024E1FEAF|nr:hypothetical protein [Alloalcanivorax xenomutans]
MNWTLRKLLSQREVRRTFGFIGKSKYEKFIEACTSQLLEVVDCETTVVEIYPQENWHDRGGDIHARFSGKITRRGCAAEIGGTMVWLRRLRTFRGYFWSSLKPQTDAELFSDAKRLFYSGNYSGYLSVSGYLAKAYSKNRVYQRMNAIAEKNA